MAAQSGLVFQGIKEVNKRLKDLQEDQDGVKKANIEAAERLIKAALPLVPVRTGALKATLKPAKTATYAAARAGLNSVPYANPIHWGWARVGAKHKGKLRPGGPRSFRNVPPQPFFSEALGYTYEEIRDNYERNMQLLITKHKL